MELVQLISKELKLSPDYLQNIINRSKYYYHSYCIKKKNGKYREISQAGPELKTLQYWLIERIFKHIPVSKAAFAYKKGDSIKRHAEYHMNSRHILHADIKDFFPESTPHHLGPILRKNQGIFKEMDVDVENAISTICGICFRFNSLCIGTVSSPIISNIILYDFDNSVIEYCERYDLKYSRYADDIYISSKDFIPMDILTFLEKKLNENNYKLNKQKTRFYSQKCGIKVTGIYVTNNAGITIGSKRRTEIKKLIYKKLIHNEGDSNVILGYLSFLKDIEPHTYNNIISKYSRYCKNDVIKELKNITK